MSESIFIPVGVETVDDATEKPSKTYKLDLDRGRIAGYVDGQEAVRQATRKVLMTPRFKCLIYNHQYGSETEDAVTVNDATREYTEAVVPFFVKDALKPDTRILDVYDFEISFEDEKAYIRFVEDTIFGRVTIEEVIGNV